jgi:hypothetical protein
MNTILRLTILNCLLIASSPLFAADYTLKLLQPSPQDASAAAINQKGDVVGMNLTHNVVGDRGYITEKQQALQLR